MLHVTTLGTAAVKDERVLGTRQTSQTSSYGQCMGVQQYGLEMTKTVRGGVAIA